MKVWLFILLNSTAFIFPIKGQDSSFTYPKGWYISVGGGATLPTLGQKNEGPLNNGYLSGSAFSFPIVEYHLKPKWSLQIKIGINNYKYNVNNFESYLNSSGYKVGDQNLNGSVGHFYLQTGLYKTIWQKGINYLETGLLMGFGAVKASNVFYLGLKEKEGQFVGTGPFYDVKNIRYGLNDPKRSKFHYGLSLRFKQIYKSNDGFFIDLQFLRFQSHRVYKTNAELSNEGKVFLLSPTFGLVFKI